MLTLQLMVALWHFPLVFLNIRPIIWNFFAPMLFCHNYEIKWILPLLCPVTWKYWRSFLFILSSLWILMIYCNRTYRNKVAAKEFIPWPIEIRFCEPNNSTNQTKSPPRLIHVPCVFLQNIVEWIWLRFHVDVAHVFLYTHTFTWFVLLGYTTYVAVWGTGLEQKESCQMIRLCIGNNTFELLTYLCLCLCKLSTMNI